MVTLYLLLGKPDITLTIQEAVQGCTVFEPKDGILVKAAADGCAVCGSND